MKTVLQGTTVLEDLYSQFKHNKHFRSDINGIMKFFLK